MSLVLVTEPDEEPITLAQAKSFARVTITDDDADIDALILSARRHAETVTRRALVKQTWDLFLDRFPAGRRPIVIPKPPLRSVVKVDYVDDQGATQTWPSSQYEVDAAAEPGCLRPVDGVSYPTTARQMNAVAVRFEAGYDDAPGVPETIRLAIKMLVHHWYDNRGPLSFGTIVVPIPISIDDLLNSEAVIRF